VRHSRIDEYARLLVDRSVGVQPGWQVVVRSTPLARPLVDAVQEQIARRGAFPFLQLAWDQFGGPFVREAPLEVLAEPAPIQLHMWETCDAFISISAPENVREGADLSDELRRRLQKRLEPLRRRQMAMDVPLVICEYPTNAAAQEPRLRREDRRDRPSCDREPLLLDGPAEWRSALRRRDLMQEGGRWL
jgi:aminopeptidase